MGLVKLMLVTTPRGKCRVYSALSQRPDAFCVNLLRLVDPACGAFVLNDNLHRLLVLRWACSEASLMSFLRFVQIVVLGSLVMPVGIWSSHVQSMRTANEHLYS